MSACLTTRIDTAMPVLIAPYRQGEILSPGPACPRIRKERGFSSVTVVIAGESGTGFGRRAAQNMFAFDIWPKLAEAGDDEFAAAAGRRADTAHGAHKNCTDHLCVQLPHARRSSIGSSVYADTVIR